MPLIHNQVWLYGQEAGTTSQARNYNTKTKQMLTLRCDESAAGPRHHRSMFDSTCHQAPQSSGHSKRVCDENATDAAGKGPSVPAKSSPQLPSEARPNKAILRRALFNGGPEHSELFALQGVQRRKCILLGCGSRGHGRRLLLLRLSEGCQIIQICIGGC